MLSGRRLVVVDGPNRSGKTTLINGLVDQFNYDVHFKGNAAASSRQAEINAWNMLMGMAANPTKSYLCDRLHYPTDIVYRRAFGDANEMPMYDTGVKRLAELLGVTFVFVIAEDEDLVARHQALPKHWHVGDSIEPLLKIAAQYRKLIQEFMLPYTVINTSESTPEEAINIAETYIDERSHIQGVEFTPGFVDQLR